MRNFFKYLAFAPFLFLGKSSVDQIRIREGVGFSYELDYKRGSHQISRLCENGRLEDAWFFDGKYWWDVGIESRVNKTIIDRGMIMELADRSDVKIFTHNHPTNPKFKRYDYYPPSSTDLVNMSKYTDCLNIGEIEVNDFCGTWEYYFDSGKYDKEKKDSIIREYKKHLNTFIVLEKFPNFNPQEEIEKLENKARDLGIYLKYKKRN